MLKLSGAASVHALDIDAEVVARAAKAFTGLGVNFLVDDCEKLDHVEPPFDLITNFENLEHLREPARFLAAASRLLAPGGRLLLSTPDRAVTSPFVAGRPANPHHHHEWYAEELRGLLEQHYRTVELQVQVQATAAASRDRAVKALRQGLLWADFPLISIWRKLPFWKGKEHRPWRQLDWLAAPSPADYPIVHPALTPFFGRPFAHLAICSHPLS